MHAGAGAVKGICGLRRRHAARRGNVLVAAFFISVFLFFLCTAMVFDARQSLFLSFHTGNRLRALNMARGAANFALYTMKTNPKWENLFTGGNRWRYKEEEGAFWEVWTERYRDGQNTGYFWLIKGRGYALGKMAAYNILVEEVSFPTYSLFAYAASGRLMMCTPRYRWMDLGPPPTTGAFLAAGDGPLFTFDNSRAVSDPLGTVTDFTYQRMPEGYYDITEILEQGTPLEDTHLVSLAVTGTAVEWKPIADPRRQSGGTVYEREEASIDGRPWTGDGAQIDAARETLTDDFGTYSVITRPVTGEALDIYVPTGTALAANGKRVYCHALHYYFKPSYLKNNYRYEDTWGVDPATGAQRPMRRLVFTPEYFPAQLYDAVPAVLSFDIDAGQWTVVADSLTGATCSYRDTVTQATGNEPMTDTLAYHEGQLYAQRAGPGGAPTNVIINLVPPVTETVSPGVSRGLFSYGAALLMHRPAGETTQGWPIVSLGDLDVNAGLGATIAEVNYTAPRDSAPVFVSPEIQYNHSLIGSVVSCPSGASFMRQPFGNNAAAARGQYLFAMGRLRRTLVNTEGKSFFEPFTADYLTNFAVLEGMQIFKYDGRFWQVLSEDLHRLAINVSPVPLHRDDVVIPGVSPGSWQSLDPNHIAAASYPDYRDQLDRIFRPVAVNQESE